MTTSQPLVSSTVLSVCQEKDCSHLSCENGFALDTFGCRTCQCLDGKVTFFSKTVSYHPSHISNSHPTVTILTSDRGPTLVYVCHITLSAIQAQILCTINTHWVYLSDVTDWFFLAQTIFQSSVLAVHCWTITKNYSTDFSSRKWNHFSQHWKVGCHFYFRILDTSCH